MKQKIIIIILLTLVTAFVAIITKNDIVKTRLQNEIINTVDTTVSTKVAMQNVPVFKIGQTITDEYSIPHTDVFISQNGKADVKVGIYQGECNVLESSTPDYFGVVAQAGTLARVQCYFAGAGDQVVITDIGTEYSIDSRSFYEGDSESNGPVAGPFAKMFTIAK